ncbi:SURF1 family protein [Lentisalinibacter sediminis]|uniref:SURF1 family protein n=1 Tax=Lentisalinibacter sediminis TaxID=2992237 RepID=UPI003863FA32
MSDVDDTRREFRPALVPTLLTVALMPVLIGLGVWQLSRYEYKTGLEQAYAASGAEPVAADAVSADDRDRFRPVTARGRYDSERQFLIDNMVSRGRNGFLVITPFRLDSGGLLLVNRGWIAQDARRRPAADIAVGEGTRRIEGRVGRLPVAGLDLGGGDGAAGAWPSVRQFPDIPELSAALSHPVAPWVLLLAPEAADGFRREWEPGGMPASRHLGYAVQWFALAAALAVIYVVVNVRRRPQAASGNE